jgi:LAS superfamily LD-carboxypeptidase LdcB
MIIPTNNVIISGDVDKQLLGLTDQHIHYLTNENSIKAGKASPKAQVGIHQQMRTAFKALKKSAEKVGIEIKIASGFRSFERQLLIWNNKFTGKTAIKNANGDTVDISCLSDRQIIEAILLFSALPGASRHHWGCDIDVYAPNLLAPGTSLKLEPWEYQTSGPLERLSHWLTEHAEEFDFYLPYDCYRGGVAEEPWHLSFAPLAHQYQSTFNVEKFKTCLMNTNIEGKMIIIDNLSYIANRYINNISNKISKT